MPYADLWNVTDPAGTDLAENIDDHIRKLRRQIQERLNGVVVVDWAADPVVLTDLALGIPAAPKKLLISAPEFQGLGGMIFIAGSGLYRLLNNNQLQIASLTLPPGANVTKVEILVHRDSATSIDWYFGKTSFNLAPVITTLASGNRSTAGVGIIDTGTIGVDGEVISADAMYHIAVNANSSIGPGRLYGARVTYTITDGRITL